MSNYGFNGMQLDPSQLLDAFYSGVMYLCSITAFNLNLIIHMYILIQHTSIYIRIASSTFIGTRIQQNNIYKINNSYKEYNKNQYHLANK